MGLKTKFGLGITKLKKQTCHSNYSKGKISVVNEFTPSTDTAWHCTCPAVQRRLCSSAASWDRRDFTEYTHSEAGVTVS